MPNPFGFTSGLTSLFDTVSDWFDGDDEDEKRKRQAQPDYRTLFDDEPEAETVPGTGFSGTQQQPRQTRLVDDADDQRFPAFQQAWRDGKPVEELLGRQPFRLKATINGNGGDNLRPDIAKVQVLLNKAGYHDIDDEEGPNGYHSARLDKDIRKFQQEQGLQVDGKLLPAGETIRELESTLSPPARSGSSPALTPKPETIPSTNTPLEATPRPPFLSKVAQLPDKEADARFAKIIPDILKSEGGYSENKHDPGGKTHFGITEDTLSIYQKINGNLGTDGKKLEPKDITVDQAKEIYRKQFFYGQRIHEIKDDLVAAAMLDGVILHNNESAWTMMQNALNSIDSKDQINVEEIGGSKTIARINRVPKEKIPELLSEFTANRRAYLSKNPNISVFGNGWKNRLDRDEAERLRRATNDASP